MNPLGVDTSCFHGFQHERGGLNHLIKCFETPPQQKVIDREKPNAYGDKEYYTSLYGFPILSLAFVKVLTQRTRRPVVLREEDQDDECQHIGHDGEEVRIDVYKRQVVAIWGCLKRGSPFLS